MRYIGIVVALASLFVARPTHAWRTAAFEGRQVSGVVVNQQRPNELAAIVDHHLQLSRDDGTWWQPAGPDVAVTCVSYGVAPNQIVIGSESGVYISDDAGVHWQAASAELTAADVGAVVATSQGLFVSYLLGGGAVHHAARLAGGQLTELGLPATSGFAYDAATGLLAAATQSGVYISSDDGSHWQHGQGSGTTGGEVVIDGSTLWELAGDGLYRSLGGATWNRLATTGQFNNDNYGDWIQLKGLAISHERAFYGAQNPFAPPKVLLEYDGGGARSIYNATVNDVAAGDRLWVATPSGLIVDDDLASAPPAVKRPLLIIPGIMGSMPSPSGWVLDPINHTYDGLISGLQNGGYTMGSTLFSFGYNWLQNNTASAGQLDAKLQEIQHLCSCNQIDIVAHSMGGLVARSYIESNHYRNNVASLIELGTPNAGAVGAYAAWEAGDLSDHIPSISNQLLSRVVGALTGSGLASVRTQFIHDHVPSVQQLLPTFDYLDGRPYPVGYPRNSWLEDLDSATHTAELLQRAGLYAVGSNSRSTDVALGLGASSGLWPDGAIATHHAGPGDGTVPASSLESIIPAATWLDGDHGSIVNLSVPFILRTLTGGYSGLVPPVALEPDPITAIVSATGPVVLEFSHATYYSGPTADFNIASIDGPCRITVRATAAGEYHLVVAGDQVASASGVLASSQTATYDYDPATSSLNPIVLNSPTPESTLAQTTSPTGTAASDVGPARQAAQEVQSSIAELLVRTGVGDVPWVILAVLSSVIAYIAWWLRRGK